MPKKIKEIEKNEEIEKIKNKLYENISLKEVAFLIEKNIFCGFCSSSSKPLEDESFDEYKKRVSGASADSEYYINIFKKWNQIMQAFDIKGLIVKNASYGQQYKLSASEAIFIYKIFLRTRDEEFIWKKIRNVKNDNFQGFLEIYYSLPQNKRKQFVKEIDFFIYATLDCLNEKHSTDELLEIEKHLLFITQRSKIHMIETIDEIQFIPNSDINNISILYYFEYIKLIKLMSKHFTDHISKINKDFVNSCGITYKFAEASNYQSPLTHSQYRKYESDYINKINNVFSNQDEDEKKLKDQPSTFPSEVDKLMEIENIAKEFESRVQIYTYLIFPVLQKLLECLKGLYGNKYDNVKYGDLKNPKESIIFSKQGNLPKSFPSDFIHASLMLEKDERILLYNYYNDYNLDIE